MTRYVKNHKNAQPPPLSRLTYMCSFLGIITEIEYNIESLKGVM